ncbi:hypothetical protein [Gemmatimonas sp.]|uniref:hypothetical protein n=1 Tax=Gemmatimonas sp. TaxID=1962908 RepID=UPI003340F546
MTVLQSFGLALGVIVSFITILGAVIAAGAWILRTHHKTNVEPAIAKVHHSLERTIEATNANTHALARAEQSSRETQRENHEAFEGIREIVNDVRNEQSKHGARLDGHDIELRDVKRHIGATRD